MGGIRWIGVLAVATGLLVGACGEDEEEGGSTAEAPKAEQQPAGGGKAGATVKLTATEFKFDPANPKVAKAGKVKFELTNEGQAPHALEVEGPTGEVETKTIQGGQSASVTADLSKPGSYVIYCPVGNHRDQGMEGKVTVAGGGSGSAKEEDDSGGGGGGY
jgi:plastocyanin